LSDAQAGAGPRVSDLLARLPPIGIAREHSETWRELLAAQAECQRLEQELRAVLARVQADALDLVTERLREREQQQQPITQYRELYDLWVECGEQVYAKVAHSPAYGKLQAELGNAAMRVRSHQQKVLEQGLKQFDLPTRSELNTVHRQLREQREQLRELREQMAGGVPKAQPAAHPRSPPQGQSKAQPKPQPKPKRRPPAVKASAQPTRAPARAKSRKSR
jgi:class III poly(R)-hydroxyalkanoic acid synthase PhaE subunit